SAAWPERRSSLRRSPAAAARGTTRRPRARVPAARPPGVPPRRAAQRALKLEDIGGEGGGIEADGRAVGEDDGAGRHAGRLEHVAEEGEGIAEIVAAGFRLRLGPEHLDQHVARLGRGGGRGVEGEKGEEGGSLLGAEASDLLL